MEEVKEHWAFAPLLFSFLALFLTLADLRIDGKIDFAYWVWLIIGSMIVVYLILYRIKQKEKKAHQ